MADFKYAELFLEDSVDKQLHIEFDGGVITNTELHSQQFELNESLCSEEQLRFGSCEASSIKFKVSNVFIPLKNKWLTVSEILGENEDESFLIGKYKVYSDIPTDDRRYRNVTAYDSMHDILIADLADWYNSQKFPMKLKQFRNSFFEYLGIEQEPAILVNDDMIVEKTIEPSELAGKVVVTAICEINGRFGHINRAGKFEYKFLPEISSGLYPANDLCPADNLVPSGSNTELIKSSVYIKCKYEDFTVQTITKLQIRQEENDIGTIVGTGDNCYVIEDNFLVYGKSADELADIAQNVFSSICNIWYMPFEVEAKGNPCLEVGDSLRIHTQNTIVESYILKRTLKGIQALRDSYCAEGKEIYDGNVNSVNKDIIQLRGKTNTLIRTVEETRLEIKDIEAGLTSRITQTATSIATEVQRATDVEESLSSKISMTADSIDLEIARATNAESNISSRIKLAEDSIALKVEKGTVSSCISQESDLITINSNRFVLESTNCTITKDGTITAKNGKFSGTIESTNAKITGGEIKLVASSASDNLIKLSYGNSSVIILGNSIIVSDSHSITNIDGVSVTTDRVDSEVIATNTIRSKRSTTSKINISNDLVLVGSNIEVPSTSKIVVDGTIELKMIGSIKNGTYELLSYGTSGPVVGNASGNIGFFGGNGSSRKTVSAITSTASATAATNATKINEIITALKAYNLIG